MRTYGYDSGTVRAVATPSHPEANRPALYLHSATNTPRELYGHFLLPSLRAIARRLTRAGYSVVCPLAAGSYGNDAGLTASEAGLAAHRLTWKGDARPPIVVASSMGTTNALRLALDGAETPACLILFNPVVDLVSIYEDDIGNFRAAIAAAWGVEHPAPLPADADILGRAGDLDVPILAYYASDDILAVGVTEFASASGATVVNVGAVGHDDDPIAAAPIDTLIAFIREHAA